MSFMYNPIPFDDEQAVNIVKTSGEGLQVTSFDEVMKVICDCANGNRIMLIDGYISADFQRVERALKKRCSSHHIITTDLLMKSEDSIRKMLIPNLPQDVPEDPDGIFGKLYEGDMQDFFDEGKIKHFLQQYEDSQDNVILLGYGSSMASFRSFADRIFYIDLTPKDAVLRAQKGCYRNIGECVDSSFQQMIRRYYYVDVEILMELRKELVQSDCIDYYVLETWKDDWQLLSRNLYKEIFDVLVKRPFRAKPVYLEGIWGGEFLRKLRHIPMDIAPRIAWIFEFIPLEASIVAQVGESCYDIPFYTLLNAKEKEILGKEVQQRFHGNFPVRFNYDDTWHSDGNMSIQVHPNAVFAKANYHESHSQDEAYYVVITGHDAKTYCGFKKDGKQFIDYCEKAQKEKKVLDYQKYIHAIPSYPGMQVMIPNGTVHSSGRNQVVLELGSYTVGAYTYKMYDYNRQDLDGKFRPIHLLNAKQVLKCDRDEEWVNRHAKIEPILIAEGEGYQETVIGRNDYMYYETHCIQMSAHAIYEGDNDCKFTVLTLVDGEEVLIYDKHHPEYEYHAHYLDVITLPAHIDHYVVKALGYQPITLHKTIMKLEE